MGSSRRDLGEYPGLVTTITHHRPAGEDGRRAHDAEVARLRREGKSIAETAEILGISLTTVSRARARVRFDPDESGIVRNWKPQVAGMMAPLVEWYRLWREGFFDGLGPDDEPSLEQELVVTNAITAFGDFFVTYSGNKYLPNHAREWLRAFFLYDRYLLNVPPRHAKSEIMTQWVSIMLVCLDRNVQILIMSGTNDQAKKFSNRISFILETSRDLIGDFGRFRPINDIDKWAPLTGMLMVEGRERASESGDMTLQIKGMKQGILGAEADFIFGDDPVSRDSANSEAARRDTEDRWVGDVMTRLAPRCKVGVIGQCIHFADLYDTLGKQRYSLGPKAGQPLYKRIKYPAVLDWDKGQVLWPENWPFERLIETYESLKIRNDTWIWEAMYQQNPLPAGSRVIQPVFIYGDRDEGGPYAGCLDRERMLGDPMPRYWDVQTDGTRGAEWKWVTAVSIDPSPERNTGIILADVRYSPTSETPFFAGVRRAIRGRMNVEDMVRELEKLVEDPTINLDYVVFEHNAFARWFLQDPRFHRFQDKYNVRVEKHTTGRNKSDPSYGLQTLAYPFEFGRIRIPWGDGAAQDEMAGLIDEATGYPHGPYNDLLMALWFLAYNYTRLSPIVLPSTAPARDDGRHTGFKAPKRVRPFNRRR